ncbi:C4-dicarboxylate transporter/malic acid transport protein [[Clostridium] sordellii]|uniref:TDT family transporter n=1 Tax=Paraclostridium sordellii TaxID=1505 RepID=UPI0005E3F66D|nr:TDT family transporter [Paeniclostridium sordellii]CEN31068.1 C4-dicarboxylate transporter/malic acid transport protein [[Clostridium] sordellii] [Paeniclostridium sordellii]
MKTIRKEISKSDFQNIPIAIAGISLGFMSISTALVEFNIFWVRHLAVIFSSISILILLMKTFLHPKQVWKELKNPLAGSIYPTISMTIMLIAVYIVKLNLQFAKVLWIGATILHLVIFIMFTVHMLRNFKITNMLPSWFISTVGIGLAAVTSKPMEMTYLSRAIFYYSLILFIVLGIIMTYRLIFMEKLEGNKKFTLMIMTAPANICLAGYLAVYEKPNIVLLQILALLGYASIIYSFILLPRLINTKFTLALAPLTFPLGIGVTAAQRYIKYLNSIGSGIEEILRYILYIQVIVSVAVIGYIVIKTIDLFVKEFILIENNLERID